MTGENISRKKKEIEREMEFQTKFKRLKQMCIDTKKAYSMPPETVAPNDDTPKDHAPNDEW